MNIKQLFMDFKVAHNKLERNLMKVLVKKNSWKIILNQFKCTVCNISYRYEKDLNEHRVKNHSMLLPYNCDICNSSFFWKDELLEHEATHESDLSSDDDFEVNYSKFKCIDCNLTFSSEDNFKVHMSLKHDRSFLNSTVDLNENENEISTNLNNESQQGVQVQTPDVDLLSNR